MKAFGDKQVLPVLTAIDVESGMAMAVLVQDKNQQQQYLIRCLQTFMFECGRAQATLSTTTLQSDQEEYIQNLLKAVVQKLGNNVNIRQSPAYSSQSQGRIERFHRTLMGQVRALVQQSDHKLQPYIERTTSDHAVDRTACGLATEQVCHAQRRKNKLPKTMAEGPQSTTMRDGRNSTIHDTNNKSATQDGAKILQRNLAWQKHNDWRVNSWHPWQGHQSKNNTKTDRARQVRQTTIGYYQRVSMELATLPTTPMAIPPQLLLPADNTQADITVEDTSTQTVLETPLALPARAMHQGYDNGNITIGNFTNNSGKTTTANTTSKQATTRGAYR